MANPTENTAADDLYRTLNQETTTHNTMSGTIGSVVTTTIKLTINAGIFASGILFYDATDPQNALERAAAIFMAITTTLFSIAYALANFDKVSAFFRANKSTSHKITSGAFSTLSIAAGLLTYKSGKELTNNTIPRLALSANSLFLAHGLFGIAQSLVLVQGNKDNTKMGLTTRIATSIAGSTGTALFFLIQVMPVLTHDKSMSDLEKPQYELGAVSSIFFTVNAQNLYDAVVDLAERLRNQHDNNTNEETRLISAA